MSYLIPKNFIDYQSMATNFLHTLSAKSSEIKSLGFRVTILALDCLRTIAFVLGVQKSWIQSERRGDVVMLAFHLTTPNMSGFTKMKIITAIAKIPLQEREGVIAYAAQLINPYRDFLDIDSRLLNDRILLIEAIAAISADERNSVTTHAVQVVDPEMNSFDKKDLIDAIAAISADERNSVTAHAVQFIDPNMSLRDRKYLINAVAAIPLNQRDEIIARAARLVGDNNKKGMHHLIGQIEAIPINQRDEIIAHVEQLITPDMSANEISTEIIRAQGEAQGKIDAAQFMDTIIREVQASTAASVTQIAAHNQIIFDQLTELRTIAENLLENARETAQIQESGDAPTP